MFFNIIFCSYLDVTKWLQNNLIPCPFKKITGFDCPLCGLQRSVIALLQGEINKSLHLYPATIPLFAVAAFSILDSRYSFNKSRYIKKCLYVFTGIIIAGSYLFKMGRYI
jgi:hypothetical protein